MFTANIKIMEVLTNGYLQETSESSPSESDYPSRTTSSVQSSPRHCVFAASDRISYSCSDPILLTRLVAKQPQRAPSLGCYSANWLVLNWPSPGNRAGWFLISHCQRGPSPGAAGCPGRGRSWRFWGDCRQGRAASGWARRGEARASRSRSRCSETSEILLPCWVVICN